VDLAQSQRSPSHGHRGKSPSEWSLVWPLPVSGAVMVMSVAGGSTISGVGSSYVLDAVDCSNPADVGSGRTIAGQFRALGGERWLGVV